MTPLSVREKDLLFQYSEWLDEERKLVSQPGADNDFDESTHQELVDAFIEQL